jgi:hypothetical protein
MYDLFASAARSSEVLYNVRDDWSDQLVVSVTEQAGVEATLVLKRYPVQILSTLFCVPTDFPWPPDE